MENYQPPTAIWSPPDGELIVSVQNMAGKILVFTDRGVYSLYPSEVWYKRFWRWVWKRS